MANALYEVQDDDRPMWVLAEGFTEAINKWSAMIAKENPDCGYDKEPATPLGVRLVCDPTELLI